MWERHMKSATKSKSFWDQIMRACFVVSAGLILFAMLITTVEVVIRYTTRRPMADTFEIVEYSLLWMGYLGAAWVLKGEGHTRMDIVLMRLSPRVQAGLNSFTSVICAGMWLLLTWVGLKVVLHNFQTGYYLATLLTPPLWPILLVIPLGGFLLFVQFLRRAGGYAQIWRALGEENGAAERGHAEELRA